MKLLPAIFADAPGAAVKKGANWRAARRAAFYTIAVTDGIAMGHDGMRSSLPSRESSPIGQLTVRGHSYDALVGLAGCDKSLPGMMMAWSASTCRRSSFMAARSCRAISVASR